MNLSPPIQSVALLCRLLVLLPALTLVLAACGNSITTVADGADLVHPETAGAALAGVARRAELRATGDSRVSAAALSREESEAVFGADLGAVEVQPVWIKVENLSDRPVFALHHSVDSDYFPPFEVARRIGALSNASAPNAYGLLSEQILPGHILARETVSGFVYTPLDEGLKAFTIALYSQGQRKEFSFVAPVPGVPATYLEPPANSLRGPRTDFTGDDGLRNWLRSADMVTTDAEGTPGDPLNIVVVGALADVRAAFVPLGWDISAPITASSVGRIATAFLFGNRLRYAPVSDLYLFGRRQDLAFQKSRPTIVERNHLRLWLAPVTYRGRGVWLGQVSRDAGLKLTGELWPPTTHRIDPDVDEAQAYVLQDLFSGERLERFAYTVVVNPASPAAPRRNAEGDPWFSAGRRVVLFLSDADAPDRIATYADWVPLESLARPRGTRLVTE